MELKNLSIFLPTIGLVTAVVVCQMSATLPAVHSLDTSNLTSSPQQATQPQNKSSGVPASNTTLEVVRSSGNGSPPSEKKERGVGIYAVGGHGEGGALAAVGGSGGGGAPAAVGGSGGGAAAAASGGDDGEASWLLVNSAGKGFVSGSRVPGVVLVN